jgi:hypothetical protein
MFPSGSKLFLGLTGATAAAFVVYGFTQSWGLLSVVSLAFAAIALALLVGMSLFTRDGYVSPRDEAGVAAAPASRPAPRASVTPLIGAAGGVVLVIGLVTDRRWFVAGLGLLTIALGEWLVLAWSERATADPAYNAKIRGTLIYPLQLPLVGAVGLGILIYSFSRIMLKANTTVGPTLFIALAALITLFGFVFSAKRRPSRAVVAGICTVGALAVVAGGIWAGASGERPSLAAEGVIFRDKPGQPSVRSECGVDVNEADKNASVAVSAKSGINAVIVLRGNTLSATQSGSPVDTVTIARGTTVNIMFKNESGTPTKRRLNAQYLVDAVDANGKPTTALAAKTTCTQAIASGKAQMLTLSFPKPSLAAPADKPFLFEVPGVTGAQIQIEVL